MDYAKERTLMYPAAEKGSKQTEKTEIVLNKGEVKIHEIRNCWIAKCGKEYTV